MFPSDIKTFSVAVGQRRGTKNDNVGRILADKRYKGEAIAKSIKPRWGWQLFRQPPELGVAERLEIAFCHEKPKSNFSLSK